LVEKAECFAFVKRLAVKIVSEMTYSLLGSTLSPTLLSAQMKSSLNDIN